MTGKKPGEHKGRGKAEVQGDLIPTTVAAKILGALPGTVARWAALGKIPAQRIGPRDWYFRRADVEAFKAERRRSKRERAPHKVVARRAGLR